MSDKDMKTYKIDGLLKGYSSPSKCRDIYNELKDSILLEDPIQKSDGLTIKLSSSYGNHRDGEYGWELYSLDTCMFVLEYRGIWNGYAFDGLKPKPEDAELKSLKLTIHGNDSELENKIDELIEKYPRN